MAGLVCLNTMDADLSLKIEPDNLAVATRTDGALNILVSCCASYIRAACLDKHQNASAMYFKVKLEKNLTDGAWPALPDGPFGVDWPAPRHCARIGVSQSRVGLPLLGEAVGSWAYDSAGKVVCAGESSTFGKPFEYQDEIGCFVDLSDGKTGTIGFTRNGEWLSEAFELLDIEGPLYPHILLKGMSATASFQGDSIMGYQCWQAALCKRDGYAVGPVSPGSFRECSITMLVGLSGAGKTEWCEKQISEHPEQRYRIIGIDGLLEQLHLHKVSAEDKSTPQFTAIMKQSNDMMSRTVLLAAEVPHNYLLDHYTL